MTKFQNQINYEFARLYKNMGYSDKPLYDYKEPDENLMDYDGYSEYAKKFNLKRSDALEIIKEYSKFLLYSFKIA